jgi:hypothetical protein
VVKEPDDVAAAYLEQGRPADAKRVLKGIVAT